MKSLRIKKYKLYLLIFALCLFLIFMNWPDIFIKKVSDVRALSGDIYTQLKFSDTFFLVNLISVPFFIIGLKGPVLISAASFSVFVVFCYFQAKNIQNYVSSNHKLLLQLLPFLLPSMAYFSVVALRDSVLAVILCTLIIYFTKVYIIEEKKFYFFTDIKIIFLTFCVLSLRPEFIIYLFSIWALAVFLKSKSKIIFLFIGFPVIASGSYILIKYTLSHNFNLDMSAISNFYGMISEIRFLRQFKSDGFNSAILSITEFYELSPGEFFFRQMLAVLTVPGIPLTSFDIQNIFALLDSLILISFLTYIIYRTFKKPYKYRIFLLLSIISYLIFITPFAVNYGNIFRIRLPMMYLIYAYIYLDALEKSARNAKKKIN